MEIERNKVQQGEKVSDKPIKKGKVKSKRKKGNDFQVWIRDYLIGIGWIVQNFPTRMRPRRIKDKKTNEIIEIYAPEKNDVWGCDLLARKGMKILFVQASLDEGIKKRVEEFKEYFSALSPYESLQIWIKTEKSINIKKCFFENGDLKVIDLGKIIRRKFYLFNPLS